MTRHTDSLATRIRDRVDVDPLTGCWRWTGARHTGGYGLVRYRGDLLYTHRAAYEAWKGRIPEGYVVDHLCRVRECCCPEHLEAVPQRENTIRGIRAMTQAKIDDARRPR